MITEELLNSKGIKAPALSQHHVEVRRTWLARARTATLRPAPKRWARRLERERWIATEDLDELFDSLGIWPEENLLSRVTPMHSVPCALRPKSRQSPLHRVHAYPVETIGYALVILWRLGVPIAASDLLAPMKRRIARQAVLTGEELFVHHWRSERERRVVAFGWAPSADDTDVPLAGEWSCRRLYDGRFVLTFRVEGRPAEVVSRPSIVRDLRLSLSMIGAPQSLLQNYELQHICRNAPPAGFTEAKDTACPVAAMRKIVQEVGKR